MSWVGNVERCVGLPGGLGAARRTAHVKLVGCREEDALLFSLPSPAGSRVHVISKPELCLDNPSLTELQLWDCNDTHSKVQDNMRFVLQADGTNGSMGTVRPVKNKTRCMDVLRDEIGAPLEMSECFPDLRHKLFQLRVRDSGAAAASKSDRLLHTDSNESSKDGGHAGAQDSSPAPASASEATELTDSSARARVLDDKDSRERAALVSVDEPANVSGAGERTVVIRWAGDTNRCVGVPGGLEFAVRTAHLKLVSCSDGGALVFSPPTLRDHRFRLSAKRELCVDNPGPTELQLWDCNDTRSEAQDNMGFFLEAGGADLSTGTIRNIKNESRCMEVPRDEVGQPVQMGEVGQPVQMGECFPDFRRQLFKLCVGVDGCGDDAKDFASEQPSKAASLAS